MLSSEIRNIIPNFALSKLSFVSLLRFYVCEFFFFFLFEIYPVSYLRHDKILESQLYGDQYLNFEVAFFLIDQACAKVALVSFIY